MYSRYQALSNTERHSVVESLKLGIRLDGRSLLDNREYSIKFGKDYGSCHVTLGETRVLAQVTCEVVEPKPSRPNEGRLRIAVHIPPMAGPEFEANKINDVQDELQQLLECNIRESRCLDLEALCIMAEESVWQLKADVTVLNACGNLGDACNMAAVGALKHFHRPDVSVEEDGRVTIHSFAEREAIPTHLKKVPVCFTYAFCDVKGDEETEDLIMFTDPTNLEERVVRGRLVVGLNPHGEITSMNFPGLVMLDKKHITTCTKHAFERARNFAASLESAVEEDLKKRKTEVHHRGFVGNLSSDENLRKKIIDGKASMVKSLSTQLQQVRLMMDSTTENNSTIDADTTMEETSVKMEETDSLSSSSDDDSDEEMKEENILINRPEVVDKNTIKSAWDKKPLIIQENKSQNVKIEEIIEKPPVQGNKKKRNRARNKKNSQKTLGASDDE